MAEKKTKDDVTEAVDEAVEETPAADETPVVEETPAAEETPAVEETPVVEETPAAEETPAVEEAPAEEVVAAEEEPAVVAEAPERAPEPEASGGAADAEADEAAEATPTEPEAAPEPAGPGVKRTRSRRHVPRSLRRTRSKPEREAPATRKPLTRTPPSDEERGRRQERRGIVVSDKGDKTIVVKVDLIKAHPKYKKVVRRTVKFHAHDEANTAGVGDTVRIVETRPLSKQKRWRLAEIVEKAR